MRTEYRTRHTCGACGHKWTLTVAESMDPERRGCPRCSGTIAMKATESETMTWEQALAGVAQGAINITEGVTTIEPGSRVHRAMQAVCELGNSHAALVEACRTALHGWETDSGIDWPAKCRAALALAQS